MFDVNVKSIFPLSMMNFLEPLVTKRGKFSEKRCRIVIRKISAASGMKFFSIFPSKKKGANEHLFFAGFHYSLPNLLEFLKISQNTVERVHEAN